MNEKTVKELMSLSAPILFVGAAGGLQFFVEGDVKRYQTLIEVVVGNYQMFLIQSQPRQEDTGIPF